MNVYTNGTDTVVAESLVDVQVVVEAQYGSTFEQEGWELDEWRQVADDKPITIRLDEAPSGVPDRETKTAREWAEQEGRGLLCSTEW